MSRTPGRRTDEPDDEGMLATDGLMLSDIGQSLVELGEQLSKVGALTDKRERWNAAAEFYGPELDEVERIQAESDRADEIHAAMTKTLAGLRMFRGNYEYWERVAAEYALGHLKFTQRRTATLLGVGLSTINRWAQHPVATGEDDQQGQ